MSEIQGLLLCGDPGSPGCGVGMSEAAWVRQSPVPVEVVDPRRCIRVVRALVGARRRDEDIVIAWPTRSTVRSPRAFLSFLLASLLLRRRVRWHIHEYEIFDEIRQAVRVLLRLGATRVVTSTASTRQAVLADLGSTATQVELVVVPPVNGSAPGSVTPARTPSAQRPSAVRTVGVFGTARADKDPHWLGTVLAELPSEFTRLETIGTGWESVALPAELTDRYTVRHHGRIDDVALPDAITAWTLAVAPLDRGATDGRMSLRTPLALGVPTLTRAGRSGDLTLRAPHLFVVPEATIAEAAEAALSSTDANRIEGAEAVVKFEQDVLRRLTVALLGPTPDQVPSE